ncbi:MAG: enoyl-CoA hydratase [Porticoccaceae bacterium]|nr:enoyl-CoA hydratase [Porticoccaceae bacterium]
MSLKTVPNAQEHLLTSLSDGILTLTMNRPEARNALSAELLHGLSTQLADAAQNTDVRCIILTGAGKGFCSGGDVKAMAAMNSSARPMTIDEAIHRQRIDQRATAGQLYKIPKPTIAVLPGAAAGAGLALALACDLRIMASNAIMTTAFARVGFAGDFGGTFFMSQLVGTAKARELYYLSDRLSAKDALSLGLTNWVVEPEELSTKTHEIAARLSSGPPIAYRYMKENLNRAISSGDVDDCMDLECTHHVHCAKTEDHKNAVKAFMEKRDPSFSGL